MPGTVKAYVPIFTITLILSAFLLFSVQPLFGKMVLPLLGGTPGVWNTAMVFFQAMLLGGYAYAHLTTKFLNVRAQAILHITLLGVCVFALPIAIPEGWSQPPATENPISWLLCMMTVAIGGPFFVLAGTAPMLQRWFSTTDHPDAQNPYFLYAASNAGSMIALLSYPFVIEPLMGLQQQSHFWMYGYIILIALIAGAGFISRRGSIQTAAFDPHMPANSTAPTHKMRLTWLLLAFVPSSLMLGVTTYITTDVASAPLFWLLPLSLYLLTFIIVFARNSTLTVLRVYKWQSVALALVALMFVRDPFSVKAISVGLHLCVFFLSALICHLVLAHRRPTPQYLTEFYLIMSLGGVLGGIFNSLVAPFLFVIPLEYAFMLCISAAIPFITKDIFFSLKSAMIGYKIILIAVGAAAVALINQTSIAMAIIMMVVIFYALMTLRKNPPSFIVALLCIIVLDPGFSWSGLPNTIHIERNFFGVIRIANSEKGGMRQFLHGTTLHGAQALVDAYRLTPLSYYAASSPGGQVFDMLTKLQAQEPQKIAILGLGLGSTACFAQPNRDFVFYEIDPAIKRIAEDKNLFTFLSDCGSPYEVIIGDGRLKMMEAPDHSYDMIFLDAFSSDSIPIHLLTREAFQLYFQKLKPEGLIVVHISNRFLDLQPLVAALAKDAGAEVRFNSNTESLVAAPDIWIRASIFGIMTRGPGMIHVIDHDFKQWQTYKGPEIQPWTDDYANIFYLMWLKMQNPRAGIPK